MYIERTHTYNWWECSWALVTFQSSWLPTTVPLSQTTCFVWHKPEIPAERLQTIGVHISQVTWAWGKSQLKHSTWDHAKSSCLNNSPITSSKTIPSGREGSFTLPGSGLWGRERYLSKINWQYDKVQIFFPWKFHTFLEQWPRDALWQSYCLPFYS